jgi:hypothetical protein
MLNKNVTVVRGMEQRFVPIAKELGWVLSVTHVMDQGQVNAIHAGARVK